MPSLSDLRRAMALRDATPEQLPIEDVCHAEQFEFVRDRSRRKAALCSRRAGKSYALATEYIEDGLTDAGGLSLYVTRSKGDARRIMEGPFRQMGEALGVVVKFPEQDGQLYVQLPNKHRVWLAGCKDISEVGKFAGPKYKRAAVDESQNFPSKLLKILVEDQIEPALIDKRGIMELTGTPGPIAAGYFYEATNQGGEQTIAWPTHRWTIRENRFIPHAEEELERLLAINFGGDPNHPTYQRSWLGKWVTDLGALVYPYDAQRNGWDGVLPPGQYRIGIGGDIGFTSPTTIVPIASRVGTRELYVLEAWGKPGMLLPEIAQRLKSLQAKHAARVTVLDEGALGKGYAENLRQTYGVECEAAVKHHKRTFQELIRGLMLSGHIKLNTATCQPLIDEMQTLSWDEDCEGEAEGLPNHYCDAYLYCARAIAPAIADEDQSVPLDPAKAEQRAWREKAIRESEERQRKHSRTLRGQRELIRRAVLGK